MKISKSLVVIALLFASCQILQDEVVDPSSSAQAISSGTTSSSGGTSCISSVRSSSAQLVSFATMGAVLVPTGGCLKENGQWIENGTTVWDNAQSPWYCMDGQARATGLLQKDKCLYYGNEYVNGARFLDLQGREIVSCQNGLIVEGPKTGFEGCYDKGWHALGEVFERNSQFCQCGWDGQLQCKGSDLIDNTPRNPIYKYAFGGGWGALTQISIDADGRLSYSKTESDRYISDPNFGIPSPGFGVLGLKFNARLDPKVLNDLIVKAQNLIATKPAQMTCETTIIDAVEGSIAIGAESLSETYCNPVEPEAAKWVQSVHDYFGKDWGRVIQELIKLKLGEMP